MIKRIINWFRGIFKSAPGKSPQKSIAFSTDVLDNVSAVAEEKRSRKAVVSIGQRYADATKKPKVSVQEQSDQAVLAKATKDLRTEREDLFVRDWLPKFKERYGDKIAYVPSMYCYRLHVDDGRVDYYPKANKLFIAANNKWVKPGLRFMIERYLEKV